MAILPGLGPKEMIVLLVLGLLLFGRRLPDVGRHVGKFIMEWKQGMKGLDREVELYAGSRDQEDEDEGSGRGKAVLAFMLASYCILLLAALKYLAEH